MFIRLRSYSCYRETTRYHQLLDAIAADDKEVSPSMLYATAAVLEGCSFVNGGSQNTMCEALLKLAEVIASTDCFCREI